MPAAKTTMTSHHEIPYLIDNSSLFSRIQSLSQALWLDSQEQGRYELITALPRASCRWSAFGAVWEGERPLADYSHNPFAAARALQAAMSAGNRSSADKAGRLFTGAVIGFWSYDAHEQSHTRPLGHKPGPDFPLAAFGWYDWAIQVDHERRQTRLVFLDSCPDATRAQVLHRLSQPAPATPGFRLLDRFTPLTSRERYAADIARILDYIKAGDCYQVNYTQAFRAPFAGSPWAAYQALRGSSRSPYAACLRFPFGDILCLSPEQFVEVQGGVITTRPIKGTGPRHLTDPAQDAREAAALSASAKDRAENVMITDLLRNDLGRHAVTGSVRVPALCELRSYSLVHHLVSTVTAQLAPGSHPFGLFQDAFPGGSITGAPKRRAMEIIAELEPSARSVYCGSIAWLGADGNMDSNIAIRTLVCSGGEVWAWAGGGITADSRWEDEYQECFSKIGGLLSRLEAMR